MSGLQIWLIAFIPSQILFDFFMWFAIGNARNFMKHIGFKAIVKAEEEYEKLRRNGIDRNDYDQDDR